MRRSGSQPEGRQFVARDVNPRSQTDGLRVVGRHNLTAPNYHVSGHSRIPLNLTAFILAGGRSSRMGRDKALLDFNGSPLIQLALDCARSVADSTIIIGPQDKFSTYAPSIQDIYPDRGPLGGIYSALASTTTELNLILAIDTPLIAPTFLANLRILAENNPSHAIVPRINRRLQPLCAIYRTSCADPAHQLLAANINKVEALIQSVPHHILDTDELLRLGATTEMFLNLNTPEDYQAALQSLKRP